MFSSQTLSLLIFALVAQQACAFKFAFRANERCTSEQVDVVIAGPNAGCLKKPDKALSGVVQTTGAVDDNFSVTFFSSENCDPATEVWHSVDIIAGELDKTCFSGRNKMDQPLENGWSSYQVYDLAAE